jgi:hypothetical protein
MSLATEALPETRSHFCHFPAVLNYNTSAVIASYDAVSDAAVTVLYQWLRTLLLLDPSTPEFVLKIRGVVANSSMQALGLVPINEELDNAMIAFLQAPHCLGGGGMGDPLIKCVQDSVITILAGLQHDSVTVRASMEICLHMQETVSEISSLCEVTKWQLDVCNFCDIMQSSNFTGGSNKCKHRIRLLGTSQVKFSARMIFQLILRKC